MTTAAHKPEARNEHDLLGDRPVPANARRAIHTLRALENTNLRAFLADRLGEQPLHTILSPQNLTALGHRDDAEIS